MIYRIIAVCTAFLLLTNILSCSITSQHNLMPGDQIDSSQKIVGVVKPDGETILFNENGGQFIKDTGIIKGVAANGEPIEIALDEILHIQVEKIDTGKSIAATFGIMAIGAVALLAIVALTKESCPFVYSFDGEKYVLDAEPLGGAICKGLGRTDYSRLDHVKTYKDEYKILIRNEVEETQYLDELKLVVVDHPADLDVIYDSAGNLSYVKNPMGPVSAIDESGRNILRFVANRDMITWQSHMPLISNADHNVTKHDLIFTFPKPSGAKRAKLIINAGSSLWGSNMIRETLQLYGDQIDAWYSGINNQGPALMELEQFNKREETWYLQVNIKEGDTWSGHGYLRGQGPLIFEDVLYPIDLSNVKGDSLSIKFTPPFGFWGIDYLAIEYDFYETPEYVEMPLVYAVDDAGNDIIHQLGHPDEDYYVMARKGEWAEVSFKAPPLTDNMQRSIFIKSCGYYEIKLDKRIPIQSDFLEHIRTTPGALVEYALHLYYKFYADLLKDSLG